MSQVEVTSKDAQAKDIAVSILLLDQQTRLTDTGDTQYSHIALRIGSAQGLSAAGLALPWDPALETLTIHRYRLIRDGKPIDLLDDGSKLTIVRRETNLERSILDGHLTASFQPDDVRVGDIVDVAFTQSRHDPALGVRSQRFLAVGPGQAIGRLRIRALWPATKPVRWQATAGSLKPLERAAGTDRELIFESAGITTARPPKGAPPRYQLVNLVQITDMGSWVDVARLMAPLYTRAAQLRAASPVRAEAARIASQTADPKARALAALMLVQDKIRYLLLAMDDGGYVPAAADLSWSRRFGDCKGKTVLLLALLRELGIEARPALVSTQAGDGLDRRLPMAGLFDHVLVQAKIGNKTYWLDGTRQGDRNLDSIRTPEWGWALPLTAEGSGLIKLEPAPLLRPQQVTLVDLDASRGIDVPAPVTASIQFDGDAALVFRLGFAQLPAAERDRALREYWHIQYDFITPATVGLLDEPATQTVRLTMHGTAKMDWADNDGTRWYELDGSRLGDKLDTARDAGPDRDAPFAVAYPEWSETRETIRLPTDGRGFALSASNVDRTVGPYVFHRNVKIEGATLTADISTRTLGSEIAFAQAEPIRTELAKLYDRGSYVRPPADYRPTPADLVALRSTTPTTADGFFERGKIFFGQADYTTALSDFRAAIASAPNEARSHGFLALVLAWKGDPGAEASAAHALMLDPKSFVAWNARAISAAKAGRHADAVAALTHSLDATPSQTWALQFRASERAAANDPQNALADLDALAKAGGDPEGLKPLRVHLLAQVGRGTEAVAIQDAVVAAHPADIEARRTRGMLLFELGRRVEARADLDAVIAAKPTTGDLVDRAQMWGSADGAKRTADLALAAKLADPHDASAHKVLALDAATAGDFARADAELALARKADPSDAQIATIERRNLRLKLFAASKAGKPERADGAIAAAIRANPSDLSLVKIRAELLARQGKREDAIAVIDDMIRREPGKAEWLNERCWAKATLDVQTQTAVADCDAALKLKPATPAYLDSRGLARLRTGALEDALADYDAALMLRPDMPTSLYGRSLAKARLGLAKSSAADLAAARKANPGIDTEFQRYGLAADESIRPMPGAAAPVVVPNQSAPASGLQ